MWNKSVMRGVVTLTMGATWLVAAVYEPAAAQTAGDLRVLEGNLRAALEGKEVRLKIDMPASRDGVNVYPQRRPPRDFNDYAKDLKRYGRAIPQGHVSRITFIKVQDKYIEFQLDGGGPTRRPVWSPPPKSTREIELELKQDRSAQETQELEGLRRSREAEERQQKQEYGQVLEKWRTSGGSRFNIRYDAKVTAAELTADSLRAALQEYVQFDATMEPEPRPGAPSKGNDEQEKRTIPLVVMIKGQLGGSETIGAGIIFGTGHDRLYIVTANHVVRRRTEEIQHVQVQFQWLPGEWSQARLLETADPALDMAVLSIENLQRLGADTLRFNRVAAGMSRVQQVVYFVGFGSGQAWHTRRAPDPISSVSGDTIRFQSAFLTPGDSGGALVSEEWRIIGMVRSDQPPEGDALSVARILEKLKEWNYPVALKSDGS